MTRTEARKQSKWDLAQGLLPWAIAAGALVIYLVTLNPWLRLQSLPVVSRVAGWDWQTDLFQPVLFLATLPFRLLPEAWLPVALNAFTAVCAALTLALLARSVALLPQDRLPIQRRLERSEHSLLSTPMAWMPPLLAALACGLQLTFWENATAATGVVLDLLLFAYIIRCLLEFRVSQEQSWMTRAAFVIGLAMANDWAMIMVLPLFLVAVVWIKGFEFFRADFVLRMISFGIAGLALIFLLPAILALSPDAPAGFGRMLRHVIGSQVGQVRSLFGWFSHGNREVASWLGMVSLLPILVMGIRWPRITSDHSPIGSVFAQLAFSVTHLLFLGVGLWLAFDPPFSPRQIGHQARIVSPLVTLYYLSTLSIGYYSGYFLLLFTAQPSRHAWQKQPFDGALRVPCLAVFSTVLVLLPVGLLIKNFPIIRSVNEPIAARYGELALQSLPRNGGVVLSDDPAQLLLLRAVLAQQRAAQSFILLSTEDLPARTYRAYLHRTYPKVWPQRPDIKAPALLDGLQTLGVVEALAQNHELYYLHPSFGYYFERFYPDPRGLAWQLKHYPPGVIDGPPLTAAQIGSNEAFWRTVLEGEAGRLRELVSGSQKPAKGLRMSILGWTKSKSEPSPDAAVAARWYSIALNAWGVVLQRNGRLSEAARCFETAQELYAANRAAEANLESNKHLAAGQKMSVDLSRANAETRLGAYRQVDQLLKDNGPVDEPTLCCLLGLAFQRPGPYQAGLYRQAAQQFTRVKTLAPSCLPAQCMLAELFKFWAMPDEVLSLVAEIRTSPDTQPLNAREKLEVDFLEVAGYLAKSNDVKAVSLMEALQTAHGEDEEVQFRVAELYTVYRRFSNALAVVEQRLRVTPDNNTWLWLFAEGNLYLQMGNYSNAIPPLTRALSVQTNSAKILYSRAVAYLNGGNLPGARADYQQLLTLAPTVYQVWHGLGEIAWQQKDTNAAIRYYRGCLSNSSPATVEAKLAQRRLKQLQPGRP